MNEITMKMQADQLIRMALQEDITSEDVSTNAVMPTATKGRKPAKTANALYAF